MFSDVVTRCDSRVREDVLEDLLYLAVEIAREGREGRRIGTMFVVGDCENVLKHSRPLILDPLHGHEESQKRISDPNVRETLKELAQLDGAFLISSDGIAISAARYIAVTVKSLSIPLGLGSRHIAAASITKTTRAIAIVVSESSMVRVLEHGEIVSEIIPELWMLKKYGLVETGKEVRTQVEDDVTVLTKRRRRR